MREAANINPTAIDMIKHFGGSTSPEIQWPEDDADGEVPRLPAILARRVEELAQALVLSQGINPARNHSLMAQRWRSWEAARPPHPPSSSTTASPGKTQHMKEAYRSEACCGSSTKEVGFQMVPDPKSGLSLGANPCAGKKPKDGTGFDNFPCADAIAQAIEQSGADVTAGFTGGMSVGRTVPNTEQYFERALPSERALALEYRAQVQGRVR